MAVDLDTIARRLQEAFPGAEIEVAAWRGDDHIKVRIVSPAFVGKRRIERHRMVHDALGDWMRERIHALRLVAWTPEEAAAKAVKEDAR